MSVCITAQAIHAFIQTDRERLGTGFFIHSSASSQKFNQTFIKNNFESDLKC